MKVLDTFTIKGRGQVIAVELDRDVAIGMRLKRQRDGAEWTIAGIERKGRVGNRRGDRSGLLLRGEGWTVTGDELVWLSAVLEIPPVRRGGTVFYGDAKVFVNVVEIAEVQ